MNDTGSENTDNVCEEFSALLMKVLECDSGNIGWKCVLAQRFLEIVNKTYNNWYLWWFIGDGNGKSSMISDCILIRFGVYVDTPVIDTDSWSEDDMYMDHACTGADCQR